jgi:uncharacterized membrane protein
MYSERIEWLFSKSDFYTKRKIIVFQSPYFLILNQIIFMHKGRLEAFSDGVLAIIITIMVLEMKPPRGATLGDLSGLLPVFISYLLSFVYVGIYWNNHHHLLHTVQQVNGRILWANLNLLFWLSLMPFVTGWMGINHFQRWPVILYGIDLIMAAVSYYILSLVIIASQGADSALAKAVGKDRKGQISILIYAAGIGASFLYPIIGFAFYFFVALVWLVPDKRIANRKKISL